MENGLPYLNQDYINIMNKVLKKNRLNSIETDLFLNGTWNEEKQHFAKYFRFPEEGGYNFKFYIKDMVEYLLNTDYFTSTRWISERNIRRSFY